MHFNQPYSINAGCIKRTMLLLAVLVSVQVSMAQIKTRNGEFIGFDKFMIGDPVTKFDTTIQVIDSSVVNGIKGYYCSYKIPHPNMYQFGGIQFNFAIHPRCDYFIGSHIQCISV